MGRVFSRTQMEQYQRLDVPAMRSEILARVQDLPNHTTACVRVVRRDFSKRIRKASPRAVLQLARSLLTEPAFLYRFIAYELICHHRGALQSLGKRDLEQFGRGIASWNGVDTFACYLAGPAWREKQVPDQLIQQWARSHNRWWRRAALVCTVALNNKARGGRGDMARTLLICRMLADDHDDMVSKALSWALRELAKRYPDAAHAFLAEYQTVLAARVLREVRNKLSTGLKNPRRN